MSETATADTARPATKDPTKATANQRSQDPHVDAFCDPKAPEIFRSVAFPTEVWTPDPLDVESIHADARTVFEWLLNEATREGADKVGRLLLLLGQSGAGKTHLMRSLRTRAHQRGDGYFAYLQMTSLSGSYGRYVLHKLIDSLDKPYLTTSTRRDGTTGLMRLSNAVVETDGFDAALLDRLREGDLRLGQPASIALQLADAMANHPKFSGCNMDLLTAMILLQTSENAVRGRVIKYLRGEALSDYDRLHLGGMSPIDPDVGCTEMIVRLGRLMWAIDQSAMVICVDQLEDILHTTTQDQDHGDRFRSALTTLNQIVAQVPNAVVVVACLEDFYQTLRGDLTASIIDRIQTEKPTPVTLDANRTEDEARQLAAKHLAHLYDDYEQLPAPPSPLYPLPDDLFEHMGGKTTRDILVRLQQFRSGSIRIGGPADPSPQEASEHYRQAASESQAATESVTRATGDSITHLETLWNDFREDPTNAPPDQDESLTRLLDSAIDLVDHELSSGHSFHSDHNECDLKVRGQTRGHADTVMLMRVCNKSPRGGGRGRTLENLISTSQMDDSEPIPVFASSTDYKPKTKAAKYTKLVADLIRAGGRKVVITDSDWRAIQAMPRFRQQYGSDPGFAQWLQKTRPLSRLKSLRDLLGLDDLTPPSEPQSLASTSSAATHDSEVDDSAAENDLAKEVSSRRDSETTQDSAVAPPLGKLRVGTTRNRAAGEVLIDAQQLKRHTGILGSSGSGKTTAALNLIEQLLCQDIPVVLLDRKGDLSAYAAAGAFSEPLDHPSLSARQEDLRNWCEVVVYTPGQPDGRPIGLPVAPEGMKSMNSTDRYRSSVSASSSLASILGYKESGRQANLIAILQMAIDLLGRQTNERITLGALIDYIAEGDDELVSEIGTIKPKHFETLLEDLHTLRIRKKLLFNSDAEPLSAERLFGLNTTNSKERRKTRLSVISLKSISDKDANLFWVSQLLLELSRWMSSSPSDKLQAVVMFDEADAYLPATSKPPTKEPMENLLKRARSAGLGVMLATQSPGDLDYKCRDNVETWMIGKISEERAIGKMKGVLEECPRDVASELPRMSVGEFYLVADGQAQPIRSDRSVVETWQLSEQEITDLATNAADSMGPAEG